MHASDEQLFRQIDKILWNDWDPIGINDIVPRDEYQSYTAEVLRLKLSGVDAETIAQHLDRIEVEKMGLFSNLEHCRRVSIKIHSL